MPFDIDGQLEQFFPAEGLAHQRIGTHQARHDGGGTTAQTPRRGDRQADACFEPHRLFPGRFPDPLGCAIDQVVGAATQVAAFLTFNDQFKAFTVAFNPAHGEPVVEIKGGTEAVEAWADVGCGGRNIHNHRLADARLHHPCCPVQDSVSPERPEPALLSEQFSGRRHPGCQVTGAAGRAE